MAGASERKYFAAMAGSSQRSPSVLALATAWVLALAAEVGWLIGVYNYDGVSPPSVWGTPVWGGIIATAVVAVAWIAWRLRRPARMRFWVFLIGAFAAKGLLAAGLEELSVIVYTAAPLTVAESYRDEALSVAMALVSGVVVALIVRAIDAKQDPVVDPIAAQFD